jgi:predicted transposase YdaD
MVLFAPIIKKRMEEKARQEGRQEGRQEERRENNAEWEAWLKRRDETQANGQSFDEPSPSQVSAKNSDP